MATQAEKAELFAVLHRSDGPLLMPNPWDVGSARLLASLGFQALATTSAGYAAAAGRRDSSAAREEALANATVIAAATDLPVSADLENCFADSPDGVAETVRLAVAAGLAGCSVEDYSRDDEHPIYGRALAAERVAAAAEAAHSGPVRLVLTARAENYLHGRRDLADTIARLRSYQEAGADVLFAPGVNTAAELRQLIAAVDLPVSIVALRGTPPVAELASIGVSRISVGSGFAYAAFGGLVKAATELRDQGSYGYWDLAMPGYEAIVAAFGA